MTGILFSIPQLLDIFGIVHSACGQLYSRDEAKYVKGTHVQVIWKFNCFQILL